MYRTKQINIDHLSRVIKWNIMYGRGKSQDSTRKGCPLLSLPARQGTQTPFLWCLLTGAVLLHLRHRP
jgi:hypothetical protein